MACMKCGQDTLGNAVFCSDCLAQMEKRPVKPNTAVLLPPRTPQPIAKKKSRWHRVSKPEERLRRHRLLVRWLVAALVACVFALMLSALVVLKLLGERREYHNIGQNYGTVAGERIP